MVNFEPVQGRVPEVPEEFFHNQDVKVLYLYCQLVKLGWTADDILKIAKVKPGRVTPSRWVTTASSILALYIQTINPTPNLKLLVQFIMSVYAPCLFMAKMDSHCSKGPKHFFNLVAFSRDLFSDAPALFNVVCTVLKNNSYWIHPENMLVAFAMDDNPKLNEMALTTIQKLRKSKAKRVRKFRKPNEKFINFQAQSYDQLIDFKHFKPSLYTNPPLLKNHSLQDIKTKNFDPDIMKVPVHSQHVERFVYLTSLAGENVIGQEARDAYVINKVISSGKISAKPTKAQFLALQKRE